VAVGRFEGRCRTGLALQQHALDWRLAGVIDDLVFRLVLSLQSVLTAWCFVLPGSLTHLSFGKCFNQLFTSGVLPPALRSLELGYDFAQPFAADVLPASLRSLSICGTWNRDLAVGALPSQLCSLRLLGHYNRSFALGVLPASLRELRLGERFRMPLTPRAQFPDLLTSVVVNGQTFLI